MGYGDLALDEWLRQTLDVPVRESILYSVALEGMGVRGIADVESGRACQIIQRQEQLMDVGFRRGHARRLMAALQPMTGKAAAASESAATSSQPLHPDVELGRPASRPGSPHGSANSDIAGMGSPGTGSRTESASKAEVMGDGCRAGSVHSGPAEEAPERPVQGATPSDGLLSRSSSVVVNTNDDDDDNGGEPHFEATVNEEDDEARWERILNSI